MTSRGFKTSIKLLALPLCLSACSHGGGDLKPISENADLRGAQLADMTTAGDLSRPAKVPSFGGPVTFADGGTFGALAAADFNRDGKIDLVVASTVGRGGALHLNTTAQ